ncbi:hypothetical protein DE146DRAFT_759701 [Phaeosphaeria sp. MPI-PUGE-AT-0046c]|nr:hypothetical protein DE146DRAFT_759701 [Phaeosphaeria sp. MPI-PUGE-AT-0046c]
MASFPSDPNEFSSILRSVSMTQIPKDTGSRARAVCSSLSSQFCVSIVPDDPCTPNFSQLWHRLPVELKVSILSYNLLSPTGIKSYCIYHKSDDDHHHNSLVEYLKEERVTLEQDSKFYCLLFPGLARLLHQAYCTQNIFIMQMPYIHRRKPRFMLPPLGTRSLIREIRWETTLSESNWDHAQRFAAGNFAFDKCQFVTVFIMWPWFIDYPANTSLRPENWSERRKIVFECKGRLLFQDDDFREENVRTALAHVGTTREAIKEWIEGLVRFAQ